MKRIMVFSAHAADFCSRAGGTIAKAVEAGCEVQVVDATFGERGESSRAWSERPVPDVASVKELRKNEVEKAAAVLGCKVNFLDYDDNPLQLDSTRQDAILALIHSFQPDIILSHWTNEPLNSDHSRLTNVVLDAAHYLRCHGRFPGESLLRYPSLFFFEPTVPFTDMVDFRPNHYVDITSVWPKKLDALKLLASQPDLVHDYSLYGDYRGFQARGISGNQEVKIAEAFVRFQPMIQDPWLDRN